jgi:hypothetical protein
VGMPYSERASPLRWGARGVMCSACRLV